MTSNALVTLDALRAQISTVADRLKAFGVSPQQYIEAALVCAVKEPKVLQCTPQSIMLAMMQCAQTGLMLGRTAHILPFGTTATFCPDYKGLIELALGTGKVRSIRVRCVYEKEEKDFVYKETLDGPWIEHLPMLSTADRGKIVGAYAIADLMFNRHKVEYMRLDEIEAIRMTSKSHARGPLPDWYGRKTVVRRLCKTLPASKQLQSAMQYDDASQEVDSDGTVEDVANLQAIQSVKTSMLNAGSPIDEPEDDDMRNEFPMASDDEHDALNFQTKSVGRLADLPAGRLTELEQWCDESPNKRGMLKSRIELVFKYRQRLAEQEDMDTRGP